MTWDDAFKIVSSVLVSIGGGAAILFGLSSWLGKIWAEKILNSDRDRYQRQIETLKSELSSDVERLKSELALKLEISKRFSEKQFHLYNDLWSSLCDLKIAGDSLWERANKLNAKKFAEQLKKTEDQIFRSSLLIENWHYEKLKELIDRFSKFQFGKTRLIDLRNRSTDQVEPQDIEFTMALLHES
ncbi:MAG: hypothetical protein F6J97_25460 [Leptolyngbya sp. SIO4C1]|nr:hypothetical protein [Leptolyngbya sp. SIO4C1]